MCGFDTGFLQKAQITVPAEAERIDPKRHRRLGIITLEDLLPVLGPVMAELLHHPDRMTETGSIVFGLWSM